MVHVDKILKVHRHPLLPLLSKSIAKLKLEKARYSQGGEI